MLGVGREKMDIGDWRGGSSDVKKRYVTFYKLLLLLSSSCLSMLKLELGLMW